jgi:hypothetical protein
MPHEPDCPDGQKGYLLDPSWNPGIGHRNNTSDKVPRLFFSKGPVFSNSNRSTAEAGR